MANITHFPRFRGRKTPGGTATGASGIFKPRQMRFLLVIETVFAKPGRKVWYDDQRDVYHQISRARRWSTRGRFTPGGL